MPQTTYRSAEAEMRATAVKSGIAGVAGTVLAVTVFSPAGLGGMIGTSIASSDPGSSVSNDVYASLPAYPAPLTDVELLDIRGELERTTASLEITHAATEGKIDHLRSIAMSGSDTNLAQFAGYEPAPVAAPATLAAEPVVQVAVTASAPIETVQIAAPELAMRAEPLLFNSAGERDENLELAALLFAHEEL